MWVATTWCRIQLQGLNCFCCSVTCCFLLCNIYIRIAPRSLITLTRFRQFYNLSSQKKRMSIFWLPCLRVWIIWMTKPIVFLIQTEGIWDMASKTQKRKWQGGGGRSYSKRQASIKGFISRKDELVTSRTDPITLLLRELHCLPICFLPQFSVLAFTIWGLDS